MTAEHYASLLRELSETQADRLRALQELALFDAQQVREVPRQLETALEAVERQYQQAKSDLEHQHAETCQTIEAEYRDAESKAVLEFNRRSSEVDLQYENDVVAAEKKYKEDTWLVQSILDDTSDDSPKLQFERLKQHLVQTRDRMATQNEEVQTLYDQAGTTAENRWYRLGEDPQPESPPTTREDVEAKINEAVEAVRNNLQKISRLVIPRLFSSWLVVLLIVLLVTSAIAAPLFFFVQPQWLGLAGIGGLEWAGITSGAGVVVSILVLVVLWQLATGQMAKVIEPLQQNTVNARAWHQRWLKLAEADYKRGEKDYKTRYAAIVKQRDRSLAQHAETYEQKLEELKTDRQQTHASLAQQKETSLRTSGGKFSSDRQAEETAFQASLANLETQRQQQRTWLTDQHAQQQTERQRYREELWARCETNWTAMLHKIQDESSELEQASQKEFLDWQQINEASWTPPDQIPTGFRLGDYDVHLPSQSAPMPPGQPLVVDVPEFRLPAVLPFPETPSLLIKASGGGRSEAVALLQLSMMRCLTLLPPGDVRLTIIDPVGLGETFASFMHLADYDDLLITNRIWTEQSQIEEQLNKLTEHMENVFQKYLRNEFESIEEYNIHAGEVAEPYRILIVADFPAGFSERAAQRLVSIAASGAKCGVHTLISVDPKQSMPRDFELSRLEDGNTVLEWTRGREAATGKFINPKLGPHAKLIPDEVPGTTVMASLIRKIGELSKDIRRVEVPFHRIAPPVEAIWTADSRGEIDAPLGRAGATKLQHLKLGKGTSQHVLIAGKTGSGKSTLLHIIISALSLRYSPDEVEFYLIDFKKGVEFKTYASHRLPHARVIAVESDREFGVSVLERLDVILKERGDLFRQVGAQDIKSFRDARPDLKMPRILLIVDEFQEFFIEDDKYSQTATLLLDRLVRQGRAFGMHVLLGSQTLGGAYSLARTTVGQMAVRIALQCSETDAHLILSENNGAARLLTRPGEAIYNNANGMVEGNSPFQIAWLDDPQRDRFLERIDQLAKDRGLSWPDPIVFEGNLPADPARNPMLCELMAAHDTRTVSEPAPRVWLGDAVAIAGPSEIRFYPRSGTNLLIVGQEPNSVFGIMTNSIAALVAQKAERIELLTEVSGGIHQGRWEDVLRMLPHTVHAVSANDVTQVITEFAEEVTRRQASSGEHPPWFLVIDDLSRYRELRKSDDDYSFGFDKNKTVSPGQMFGNILKEGPALGVHLIVWCDSYNNVDRWFSRQTLREFEMRAVMQMSASDSSNLIDSPVASRLGNNRAILYSDERGTIEKFRPYGRPADSWLALWNFQSMDLPASSKSSISSTTAIVEETVPTAVSELVNSEPTSSVVEKVETAVAEEQQNQLVNDQRDGNGDHIPDVKDDPAPATSNSPAVETNPTPPVSTEVPPEGNLEVADDLSSWTVT